MMTITPLYAAILALFYVGLSFRVIGVRRSSKTSLGDGGNDELARRIRVHGNFAEYVPMGLILMAFAELQNTSSFVLQGLGICLLSGRLLHALGVSLSHLVLRVAGMVLTFATLIGGAVSLLIKI